MNTPYLQLFIYYNNVLSTILSTFLWNVSRNWVFNEDQMKFNVSKAQTVRCYNINKNYAAWNKSVTEGHIYMKCPAWATVYRQIAVAQGAEVGVGSDY